MKRFLPWFLPFLLPAACTGSTASSDASEVSRTDSAPAGPTSPGEELPAETELEPQFTAYAATGKYVWSANPTSNRVAYIDGADGSVRLADAGDGPSFLTAVPDPQGASDTALVFNVRSHDATLLRVSSAGLQTKQIPTPAGGNTWAVSPDGAYALAWTRADLVAGSANDIEGYQQVSLLHLAPGAETSTALTVGYRPNTVVFSADAARAYVINKDGISVVLLAEARLEKTISFPAVLGKNPTLVDPLLTSDGNTLFVREETSGAVVAFVLGAGVPYVLSLPGKATDIDLDGSGQRVVVVLRDVAKVALIPVPLDPSVPPSTWSFEGPNPVGSVSVAPPKNVGFFYTNAVASPTLDVAPLGGDTFTTRSVLLRAPVASVLPGPGGDFALVFHGEAPQGTTEPAIKAAVSYVQTSAGESPPVLVGLNGVPQSLVYAKDGQKALVVSQDGNKFYGNLLQLPSLAKTDIALASMPVSVGALPSINKGFVLQRHGLGRVTLVDFATNTSKTITGFELAAQVVTGE